MLDSFSSQLKLKLPEVHNHLQTENIEITCFSGYFITIFGYKIALEYGMRVIDMFLYEGESVVHNLLIKMLSLKQSKILRMNFEELFRYLSGAIAKECFEEYDMVSLLSPLTRSIQVLEDDYDFL